MNGSAPTSSQKRASHWCHAALVIVVLALALHARSARADAAMDRIIADGEIRVGLINQPPFASYDPTTRSWSGSAYDMAKLLADLAGLKLSVLECTYQNVIPALQANKIDAALSPIYGTPKRALAVWFTTPIRYERSGVLIRKDEVGQIKAIDDLNNANVTIAVALGSATEQDAHRYFPKATVKPVASDSLLLEVQGRRADAYMADMTTVERAARKNNEWAALLSPKTVFNAVPNVFLTRRGDVDVLYFLNASISYLRAQGQVAEIDARWGLTDIDPAALH